jgi:type IV pilus assembly protein PilY1
MCEGFGVSANGIAGYDSNDNGAANLTVLDAGGTLIGSDRYQTLAQISSLPGLTVAHDYKPSASPNLYEAVVTISNNTGAPVTDVRYTRVMDWDVPPTEFSEFVTLQGVGLGDLIDSCDNGFQSGDPLSDCFGIAFEDTNAVDSGPLDHGARFTFGFGGLAAGESKTFSIFYGAAGSEAAALAALGAAGAEGIYSFGQSNGGQTSGGPATFIFGFGGVGAPPIDEEPPPVPEPASLMLLGSGIAGFFARRMRKA